MERTSTFFMTNSVRPVTLEADNRLAFTTSLSSDSKSCGKIIEFMSDFLWICSYLCESHGGKETDGTTRESGQVGEKYLHFPLLWSVHNVFPSANAAQPVVSKFLHG
jgi:hypothetical protein